MALRMKHDLTYDAERHEYRIDGRMVPHVTKVLPFRHASQWHMDRGTAIHACAAYVAEGIAFQHDPQIAGPVQALRTFFKTMQPIQVVATELRVWSVGYQYAGTLDMLADVRGKLCIIDWKSSPSKTTKYQLAAYAMALPSGLGPADYGIEVALPDSGVPRISDWKLDRRLANEWLALLTAYRIREKEGWDE